MVLEINIKKGQGDKEINLLKESEIEKTANSEQMKKGQQKVQKKCQWTRQNVEQQEKESGKKIYQKIQWGDMIIGIKLRLHIL